MVTDPSVIHLFLIINKRCDESVLYVYIVIMTNWYHQEDFEISVFPAYILGIDDVDSESLLYTIIILKKILFFDRKSILYERKKKLNK